jgi:predicted DNA-binding transcriptional regulator AlpA
MPPKHTLEAIPTALQYFDSLPSAAHVRQPVLEILFACSSSTVWRRVKDGRIPKPLKLSDRVTAWNVGKLRAVLQGSVKASAPELAPADDTLSIRQRRAECEVRMTPDFNPTLSLLIDDLVQQEEALGLPDERGRP